MKKIALFLITTLIINFNVAYCGVISGKIDHNDTNFKNKIIDKKTKQPLTDAKVTIPELNYTTYTDKNGMFELNADVVEKTVLFVEKDGYKVFSLTVDNNVLRNPLKLGIEKSSPFDMQISEGLIHLGDNMFSNNSANSTDFRLNAYGPHYTQTFTRPQVAANQDVVVKIGTVIGLDTKKAKEAGQNRISRAYSSPAEVFVNGHRIGHLELNGDNIEVVVPKNILRETNELVIKTGVNLFQTEYTDYDDIELANIRIEAKEKHYWARK